MNFIQSTIQLLEVGKARVIVRIVPLVATLLIVGGAYNMIVYKGLPDAQSMDNAQLARQIATHHGFTTYVLRPQALAQLRDYASTANLTTNGAGELFPAATFPPGTPRFIPDTYNAPGYPSLLAAYFMLVRPDFNQTPDQIIAQRMFLGDRWIPFLNQFFMLLTAGLVFALGYRLFDDRVAWVSLIAFLGTHLVWSYTLTALSTSVLIFLVTGALMCVLEIYSVSESAFLNEDYPFRGAWAWGLAAMLLLAAACLTRLHLVVLLIPIFALLLLMPRPSIALALLLSLAVIAFMAPWFVHEYRISGNPLGSNFPLFLAGEGEYAGNQIYCATSIPSYDPALKDATTKELQGILWNFQHAWTLMGSCPLVLFFVASLLHSFKRGRTRAFQWLLVGCAIVLVLANNLAWARPEEVSQWNVLVLLLPCVMVIGAAYFFILLDRLNLPVPLLNSVIVAGVLALAIFPLFAALTSPVRAYYAYPPYFPPYLRVFSTLAKPDEWITTDIPWATAWYGNHPSLWLPDAIADFRNFQDNVNPSGLIFLSPESSSQPLSTFTTGEYKDWLTFVTLQPPPPNFPLGEHFTTPAGTVDYTLWSDRPRWQ